MIVTVTLNPSLDRTLAVPLLHHGEVHRAESSQEDPGGKGVNVTRFLAARGSQSVAVLPVGGPMGRALVTLLEQGAIPHRAIGIAGRTRSNVAIVEPDGTTTKVNEVGPMLTEAELSELLATLEELAVPDGWVVLAGSLPQGMTTEVVGRVAAVARAAGSRFVLDASGPALADGLAAGPDLIKPNGEELGEVLGRQLTTLEEVLEGCQEARTRGAKSVVCSLGGDGAVLVSANGSWLGRGPKVDVVSTVGAGDCLLAGYLHAGGDGPQALQEGIAWATAAVQTAGTGVPSADLILAQSVELTRLGAAPG